MNVRMAIVFLVGTLVFGKIDNAIFAQNGEKFDLLNSQWQSAYQSADDSGPERQLLKAKITIFGHEDGRGAAGKYITTDDAGNVILEGTLSQVRRERRERSTNAKNGVPVPPPGNQLEADDKETPFLVGCWEADGVDGWFKWEIYEDKGKVRFTGYWGYLEGGRQGKVEGEWRGYYEMAIDKNANPNNGTKRKAIPQIEIR